MSDANTPYVDEAGRPRLRTSIVAFFDILGFSHIATSSATVEDSQKLLDRIVAAIDESRDFVRRSFAESDVGISPSWATKFFSDNLAFGYPVDGLPEHLAVTATFVIRCAQRYQLRMAANGFFLRGALTQGPICLTDEIIFGSALIECYQLESKASIVPRVVLAEPLREWILKTALTNSAGSQVRADEAICRDVDGWWFVNYLQAACESNGVNWDLVERHKQSTLSSLSSTTRHDVLPKFGWACRYHNVFCHWHRDDPGYSDRFRVDRVDEQSTIYRMCDLPTKVDRN